MINLYDFLTEEDNKKIENYIDLYGIKKERYIGNKEYLKYWGHSKYILYKALGNKFIHKIPVTIEKSDSQLRKEIKNFLYDINLKPELNYKYPFFDFIEKTIKDAIKEKTKDIIKTSDLNDLLEVISKCTKINTYMDNKFNAVFKLKVNDKTLQLSKDMKPMRVLKKIIDFFELKDFCEIYEEFRLIHSRIFNDKKVKGSLCFSIHPLDFMTMSDNDSNWSSCMSWQSDGCYHLGTVEMMNSNNVICCYLESKTPMFFSKDKNDEYSWNNKKWRQLVYVTKDIVVTGKPYPYENNVLSKTILDELRKLLKENLKWKYTFGIEKYFDMKYVYSNEKMMNCHTWAKQKNPSHKRIIFDSKAMYNDMVNDNMTLYWCIRNKVNHTKVICYSGKSNCLCCNQEVREYNDWADYSDEGYNERYDMVNSLICSTDLNKLPQCEGSCDSPYIKGDAYEFDGGVYCETCWNEGIRICPCCNKPYEYKRNLWDKNVLILYENGKDLEYLHQLPSLSDYVDKTLDKEKIKEEKQPFWLLMCEKCNSKLREDNDKVIKKIYKVNKDYEYYYSWQKDEEIHIYVGEKDENYLMDNFFVSNLKKAPLPPPIKE